MPARRLTPRTASGSRAHRKEGAAAVESSSMASRVTVLLIGEDAPSMGCLRADLANIGFEVLAEMDAQAALERLSHPSLSLVLVEFKPPRPATGADCAAMDSFQLLRRVRLKSDVGVIVLSRESDEAVKLYLLDSGADDYVLWPCRHGELVLRMRAVVRRTGRGAVA